MFYIVSNLQSYFACVEYCTPVLVMYEMEAEALAGLSPGQKAAECRMFYEVLNRILTREEAPDFCRNIKLVKYDGKCALCNINFSLFSVI